MDKQKKIKGKLKIELSQGKGMFRDITELEVRLNNPPFPLNKQQNALEDPGQCSDVHSIYHAGYQLAV